ncbi:MAG: oligosaccharide flippase family protein [Flavobacteriales bacterium]
MSTSSVWNMVIQFIFFPILSRIYLPEIYGSFSTFNAIVVILGQILALGYYRALVIAKRDSEFSQLVRICLLNIAILGGTVGLFSIFFGDAIIYYFKMPNLGAWIYTLAPLSILFALDQIMVQWGIRNKAFKQSTAVEIPLNLGTKLFNVGYGKFIFAGVSGLILTTTLLYLGRILLFLKFVVKNPREVILRPITKSQRKKTARKYKEYPRFILSSQVLLIVSSYLPVLIVPLVFSSTEVGFFSYALLVLDLPVRLLGSGISTVYFQKGSSLWPEDKKNLQEQTKKLFKALTLVAFAVLVVLGSFAEPVYEIVFGENWGKAGSVAFLLVFSYFFRYISMPISSLFLIVRKEKALFKFQAILFVLRCLSFIITGYLGCTFLEMVLWYSIANAIMYFVYGLWSLHLIGIKWFKPAFIMLFTFALGSSLVLLSRWFFDINML